MRLDDRAAILVVDDREDNRVLLEAILAPLGEPVLLASSGEEALKYLLAEDPAVILLDVEMPGMDGYETAAHIKERERTSHIPIIFLTAHSPGTQHTHRGYSVGAVDYLFKPFDPTVLRSKISVFIDLHRLKRHSEMLAHRALHDALTGLPNRVLFLDRLQLALARLRRRSASAGVLYLDLDGFKLVNDTLGHEVGDGLLVEIAERLRAVLRPSDTVARFGGDEFVILSDSVASEREVTEIAQRVGEAIRAPCVVDGHQVSVDASIGIAIGAGGQTSPETLLREADAAMYRAKQGGGGRHELYNASMRARAEERKELEHALRQAVPRGELRLAYQPTVDLASGRVVGVEALLRWERPDGHIMEPDDFISLAEESGLILPIGEWVLREAVGQARRWRAECAAAADLVVSVNVSARQLGAPEFVEMVREILVDDDDRAHLCLEMTESSVMDDAETAVEALGALRLLGVGLAIDDFGTGYSSLAYLKRFPVDALKVDRSFVIGLEDDPHNQAIVSAVVDLAHALGLHAVAEGVETAAQLRMLRALHCDLGQGHHLCSPVPPEDVPGFLARGTGLRTAA